VELINNADAKTLCTFAHASLSVVAGAGSLLRNILLVALWRLAG
jgi:hypothetical protein